MGEAPRRAWARCRTPWAAGSASWPGSRGTRPTTCGGRSSSPPSGTLRADRAGRADLVLRRRAVPALPPRLRGTYVVSVRVAHTGPGGAGIVAPLRELDAERAGELLRRTGPAADLMGAVRVNHLGGALARPVSNAVP
ncbi:hypothetical protein [Streptomyces olivaceoviridis]|uniref:hypothetical protein n=1 Tax=Streptomyces olivaceoviridis TaxID=1921 RepID=UPI0036FB865E